MNKMIRGLSLLFAAGFLLFPQTGVRADSAELSREDLMVKSVTVNTTVRKTGQYPEEFLVTFDEALPEAEFNADDFYMTGAAGAWGSSSTHSFSCEFSSVQADGNTLTLIPENFPEKYFYVKNWEIRSRTMDSLSVDSSMVSETHTETADLFTTYTDEKNSFRWHEFAPEADGPLPVVVVFHGYGDTNNLLTYRTAVEWAEPENQAVRPCIVIAPVIDDASYINPLRRAAVFGGVLAHIDELIDAGKADPDRLYVMGNSFGGMSSLEFTECYPDRVAAVLSLCPAVGYSGTAVQNLPAMKDVPVWFAHAEHDNTIPAADSETCLNTLVEAGSTVAKRTVYTDEEMNAAGGSPSPDSTYSYHHVELAVMEDDTYMEWLFAQHRE